MNPCIKQIPIQGSASLPASSDPTGTQIAVLGPLPQDGAWSVTGKITVVDTAAAPARGGSRSMVVFYPQFSGKSIAGVVNPLDTYGSTAANPPMACQPQDRGLLGFSVVIPNPAVGASGGQAQLVVTGIPNQALTWSWDLVLEHGRSPHVAPLPSRRGAHPERQWASTAAFGAGSGWDRPRPPLDPIPTPRR